MISPALFFSLLAPLLVTARPVEFDGLELRAGAGLRELVRAAEHEDAARIWRRQESGSNGTTTAVPAVSSAELASSAAPSASLSAEPATSTSSDPAISSTEPEPTTTSAEPPAQSTSAAAPSSTAEEIVSFAQPEPTSQTTAPTTTSAAPETTSVQPETTSEPAEPTSSAPAVTTSVEPSSAAPPPTSSAAPVTTTSPASASDITPAPSSTPLASSAPLESSSLLSGINSGSFALITAPLSAPAATSSAAVASSSAPIASDSQISQTPPTTTSAPATPASSQMPLDPTTEVVIVTALPTGQQSNPSAAADSQTTTLPAGATGIEIITFTQYLTSGGSTFVNTAAGLETVVIPIYPSSPSGSAGIDIVTVFVDPGSGETGAITTDFVSERTTTDGAGIVVVETITAPIILTRVARPTDPSLQTGSSAAHLSVASPLAAGLLAVAGTTLLALCGALPLF